MTERAFLSLLNRIDFPRRYWEVCDRIRFGTSGQANLGRKEDILAAFAEAGVKARYDSRDRSFKFEEEVIGDLTWSGLFVKQRHGVELMISGTSTDARVGSNFAVLAYNAKRLADPAFERSPFGGGPPPYPRPDPGGDAAAMREVVKQHVDLVRMIKDELRRQPTAG
jgi:hypothetical protein